MYDKWSVLRVETIINTSRDFRVVRFARDSKGRMHGHWIPMSKGIGNLRRYLQVGEAANRRYLDALAAVRPVRHTIADLDTLCSGRVINGTRCPRLNPVAAPEHRSSRPRWPANTPSTASATETSRPNCIPVPHSHRWS